MADAAEIYAAVKPSGCEAEWTGPLPQLLPMLRPYQRRAVHWMVSRERQQVLLWVIVERCKRVHVPNKAIAARVTRC